MVLTSWLLLHCFHGRGYEGDSGEMSYDLGHKKCRIKVFVMCCYLDGKNGSLSRFADVEPGLGNFSKYRCIQQQQPNIQSVFHKRWRKNDHGLGTKSSNKTLRFFLGTSIHVEILLTILIRDQYDSKKLVFVSFFKKFFLPLYWVKEIEKYKW